MPVKKNDKQGVIKEFAIGTSDTGSAPVQIALLTQRISQLTEHMKSNKKDFSTKRGLLKLVAQRKKYLQYLQTQNQELYDKTKKRLGLK